MIVYLDSGGGIGAGLVLGALLDAGADAGLVQRILGTVTLPRIALVQARETTAVARGTAASVAVGPVPRGTRLLDVVQVLEKGTAPLAVRTWGGGIVTRLLEAEALVRGAALDAIPFTDVVAVAELLAVSAALAALRVVRVYAAPLKWRDQRASSGQEAMNNEHVDAARGTQRSISDTLLAEAGWPEPESGPPARVTPGGAAILAALAEPGAPAMRLGAVGYGIEPGVPHLLRCTVGEPYAVGATRIRGGIGTHTHRSNDGESH